MTVSLKGITLTNGISEPADWKLQLINSIQQVLLQRRGTRNACDIARARNCNGVLIRMEVGSRENCRYDSHLHDEVSTLRKHSNQGETSSTIEV